MENEIIIPEEIKKEISSLEEWTRTVAVRNPVERTTVYQAIQTVKAKKKTVIEFFADMKEKAHSAWKTVVSAEKTETDKLDAFEAAGKRAIMAYDRAEEEKRQAEQRRLQAIADEQARKEREKAQQEAARQAAIEREARDKAEAARRAAEAANAADRAKLMAEAAAADRKAAAAAAKSENAVNIAASVVAPVVQVAPVAEKIKGESVRKIWRAKIVNAKEIPVEYLALWIDQKKVDDFARATKGGVPVNGVEFISENTMSVRTEK